MCRKAPASGCFFCARSVSACTPALRLLKNLTPVGIADTRGAMLLWEFHFRARLSGRNREQLIRGVSHLRFAPDGKINYHRDYWDAAEELYMKLPLLGGLLRYLRSAFACRPARV